MKNNYYQPSRKFSPISLLYFAALSIIGLPILALIYSYCIWYIPFVYINLFITIGFGIGTGLIIRSFAVKIGKVRNPTIGFLLGAIGGCIALYFNWAIWVDLAINSGESYGNSRIGITVSNIEFLQVFSLIAQPGLLLELIKEIGEYGTWGIRGATVSGVFLYIIWAIEALIVIGISAILPWQKAGEPFCELSNQWYPEKELPAFDKIKNKEEFIANLEQGITPEVFSDLIKIEDVKKQSHSIFTLYTSDQGVNYLSINNKTATRNEKGEIKFESDAIVEYITISKAIIQLLEAKQTTSEQAH
ncbi:hypothetical protein [Aquimarina aquimarini]|uniref:hypothetical protein n=1 Tax=Aquimarina aquimarini TaxID=1191734 RepID=UPI001F1EB037|nr:hypothetical protein [Aquimarina aquimarini]